MAKTNEEEKEEMLDALLDLNHDLGKYIRLPLGMLPKDSGQEEIREALKNGLFYTRKSGEKSLGAFEIWQTFESAWKDRLEGFQSFGRIEKAVNEALDLTSLIKSQNAAIDREAAFLILLRVEQRITELIEEIKQ